MNTSQKAGYLHIILLASWAAGLTACSSAGFRRAEENGALRCSCGNDRKEKHFKTCMGRFEVAHEKAVIDFAKDKKAMEDYRKRLDEKIRACIPEEKIPGGSLSR